MAETLQQFLVELGFTTKNREEFERTIKHSGRVVTELGERVGKLGAIISAAGIAALKDTKAYAQAIEQLGYVAQRTGTSLRNLQALQLAGASLGSSAAGAQASIEGFASFMRRNPGGSAMLLQSLGVQTKDLKGHALDTVQVMENLSTKFQQMKASGPMGEAIALRYADMLGISENMALAMMRGSFNAKVAQYAKAEGSGVDKAYTSAHALGNQERLLSAHMFGAKARAEVPAMEAMTSALQLTNKELADTNGLLSKLLGAASAYGGAVAAGGATAAGLWAAKKILGKGAGSAAGDAAAAEEGAATAGVGLMRRLAPLARVGVGLGLYLHSDSLNKGEFSELEQRRQAEAVKKLMGMGLTRAEAIGMVANFSRESSMEANKVGDYGAAFGLAQWHAPRQAEFAKVFGHSIKHSTFDEQLQFAAWELTHKRDYAKTWAAMQAAGDHPSLQARLVSKGYERPAHAEEEATKRAAFAQTINTTINVQGSGDPAQAARKVAQAQKQVNQQLARYSQGVIR